jgi:hypothetical protein
MASILKKPIIYLNENNEILHQLKEYLHGLINRMTKYR